MKKLRFLFTFLFLLAAITSCNEVNWDFEGTGLTPDLFVKTKKLYPGGNVDCSQLGLSVLDQTTGRNNFDPSTGEFENAWPSGLVVKVTDNTVDFAIDGSLVINGKCYKVGAVIVKGSDASNVYFYTELGGVTKDKGLVPPDNASGSPAGLSNLTFCFVECKNPEWVVAFKTQMTYPGLVNPIGVSGGTDSDINSFNIGYNAYVFDQVNVYPLFNNFVEIGTITLSDIWKDDIHYLRVVVDTNDDAWGFKPSYLYIGTLAGFNSYRTLMSDGRYFVAYYNFPFQGSGIEGAASEERVFEIPFSSITQ